MNEMKTYKQIERKLKENFSFLTKQFCSKFILKFVRYNIKTFVLLFIIKQKMIKHIIKVIVPAVSIVVIYKLNKKNNDIEMNKKDILYQKYEKRVQSLGIMDGNVSFEKCKKAMDDANENKNEDEINEITELSDHLHGSLRKGNAILFHHDCSHCKTIAYITCIRIMNRTNQFSNKKSKEMSANAILSNYQHIEPYIEKKRNMS